RSFKTIVATGRNGQFIHYTPKSTKIMKGELTVIDMGAKVNRYCSDISRTIHKGIGSGKKRLYEDITEIQGKIIDIIETGMSLDELQDAYISMMKSRRHEVKHFVSHGIGLSVHEKVDELKPGMVITVEPGVYTNKGGCRIEDMILVKKSGVKVLSESIPNL
ncbi:MAG: M24 family metallopeptidase, partial [Candidatus Aenigmatarchaeota archaeon]